MLTATTITTAATTAANSASNSVNCDVQSLEANGSRRTEDKHNLITNVLTSIVGSLRKRFAFRFKAIFWSSCPTYVLTASRLLVSHKQ